MALSFLQCVQIGINATHMRLPKTATEEEVNTHTQPNAGRQMHSLGFGFLYASMSD